jgi:hypothetical protein
MPHHRPSRRNVNEKFKTMQLITCEPYMLARGHITPNERPKELEHLSFNSSSKVRTILVLLQIITQDLKHLEEY